MEKQAQGRRYVVAALIVSVAIALRLFLDYYLGLHRAPFLTLYPTLVIVAYFCGFGPGLMAFGVTSVMGFYWSFVLNRNGDTLEQVTLFMGIFCTTGLITLLIVRDMQLALEERDKRLSAVAHTNGEMRHRIKNILAIASAVASNTIRSGLSAEDASRALSGRFVALGAVYDALADDERVGVRLHDLISRVVAPLAPDASMFVATGDEVEIPPHIATTFGLILHELATNALKHGAWKDQEGKVNVGWFEEGGRLWFQWCERCGACQRTLVSETQIESTGLKLIRRALPNAEVTHEISHDGLRCTIVMPITL